MKTFCLLLTLAVAVLAKDVEIELPFKDGFDTVYTYEVEESNSTSSIKHHGKVVLKKTGSTIEMKLKDFTVDKVTNVENVAEIEKRAGETYVWKYTEPEGEYFYTWDIDALDITELFWWAKKVESTKSDVNAPDGQKYCTEVVNEKSKTEFHSLTKLEGCSHANLFSLKDKDEKVTDGKIETTKIYKDGTLHKIQDAEEIKTNKNTYVWKAAVVFEDFVKQ